MEIGIVLNSLGAGDAHDGLLKQDTIRRQFL
jgi:hypothetical protein